jgi:F0F1-type ATP synthase membrane subunit b/b'
MIDLAVLFFVGTTFIFFFLWRHAEGIKDKPKRLVEALAAWGRTEEARQLQEHQQRLIEVRKQGLDAEEEAKYMRAELDAQSERNWQEYRASVQQLQHELGKHARE